MAYHPDGSIILSDSGDKSICFWGVAATEASGRPVQRILSRMQDLQKNTFFSISVLTVKIVSLNTEEMYMACVCVCVCVCVNGCLKKESCNENLDGL